MRKCKEKGRRRVSYRFRPMLLIMLVFVLMAADAVPAAVRTSSDDTRGGLLEGLLEGITSSITTNRSLRDANIEPIPDQKYTGRSITPTIKITWLGTRLRKGIDYTVRFTNNRSAGTAKAYITGKGKYTGSRTVSFKIVRNGTTGSSSSGSSSSRTGGKTFKIKLSTTSYVYNGQYRKPSVKVTLGSKNVTASNYTVKYENNRSVGTATVTVTGKGDYKGCSGTAKFEITLKKPTLGTLKSTNAGELNVSWTKDAQADGYQIQFCTRKAFNSGEKTRYIRDNRTISTDITGLQSGKKYYVRMRSYKKVGSRNSYSDWSTVKEKVVK